MTPNKWYNVEFPFLYKSAGSWPGSMTFHNMILHILDFNINDM